MDNKLNLEYTLIIETWWQFTALLDSLPDHGVVKYQDNTNRTPQTHLLPGLRCYQRPKW